MQSNMKDQWKLGYLYVILPAALLILFCFRLCPRSFLHSLACLIPCLHTAQRGKPQVTPSYWIYFILEAVKGDLVLTTAFPA